MAKAMDSLARRAKMGLDPLFRASDYPLAAAEAHARLDARIFPALFKSGLKNCIHRFDYSSVFVFGVTLSFPANISLALSTLTC
jgi:hypothetical protein